MKTQIVSMPWSKSSSQVGRWRNFTYVDNSNLWIEGMRFSAARASGIPASSNLRNFDHSWKVDFRALMAVTNGSPGCSYLFGSHSAGSHLVFQHAVRAGFITRVSVRSVQNREVDVDEKLIEQIEKDLSERVKPGDRITLVAGDGGYEPVVRLAKSRGISVTVWSWMHALSFELFDAASETTRLEDFADEIQLLPCARRA